MKRYYHLLAVFAVVLSLVSCHSSSGSGSVAAPTKKWEFFVGKPHDVTRGSFYGQQYPAIATDGTVYAPGDRGLYALNPDGTQRWFFKAPFQSPAMPLHFAMVDDSGNIWFDFTVEINGLRGGAMAVSPNGVDLNRAVSRAGVTQIGQAPDGTIFVSMDGRGELFPPPANAGLARWEPPGYDFFFMRDGSVYSSMNSSFVAFGPDHNVAWTVQTDSGGEPAIGADGTIILGGYGGVTAIAPKGFVKWSFQRAKVLFTPTAIADDGTVYSACDDGNLYALGPDGSLKWKFTTSSELHAPPVLAKNGNIYLADTDHFLYSIGSNGKLKWKFKTDGEVFAPVLSDDGVIYFQNSEGKIFALEDSESNGGLGGQWPKRGADNRNTFRAPTSSPAP